MTVGGNGDDLIAELRGRADAEQRMVTSLVALEQRPGHTLLSTIMPTGVTAQRWAQTKDTLAGLWQDFAHYQGVVAAAKAAAPDPVHLRHLLREPVVEVGPVEVDRTLTSEVRRVQRITLTELEQRMRAAYETVDGFLTECEQLHGAFLTGLGPLAMRLNNARGIAADLDERPPELADLTARLDALDKACAADPLSLRDRPPADVLADLDTEITAITQRLTKITAVRNKWQTIMAGLHADLAALGVLSSKERQARQTAAEKIAGQPLPAPADRITALRERLSAVAGPIGWIARAREAAKLRTDLDRAEAELIEARDRADGLLERRAELRGRYDGYRAKANRLGVAEHPDLLPIDAGVRALLWTRPCDLAAATRQLNQYRDTLARTTGSRT